MANFSCKERVYLAVSKKLVRDNTKQAKRKS